ncbi:hypothetical protein AF72_00495 [Xylella taiwanensis]|uniref:Uncharacterized protein n=1 Tax=Xylella taiwanensis TaxID=1444770 RepID=Z9JMN0_9GAMM|nr:hypothetical protein AF72_00495 [Xylella taiwanensis]
MEDSLVQAGDDLNKKMNGSVWRFDINVMWWYFNLIVMLKTNRVDYF